MRRIRLVSYDVDLGSVIYMVRELNSEVPKSIDFHYCEIGRTWCRSTHPDCQEYINRSECKKML